LLGLGFGCLKTRFGVCTIRAVRAHAKARCKSRSQAPNYLPLPAAAHEPERTGSSKIRKVWLLGSDVMSLQVSRQGI